MIEIRPSADSLEIQGLPYCIQGSEAPAFLGDSENSENLTCVANCGQILIKHYAKDDYANIGIKCFKCGEITWTPRLEVGEVFAASIVSLGDKGRYLLGSTVNKPDGVILTCDQEIKREIEATAPRKSTYSPALSEEGLKSVVAKYNEIVGDKFAQQRKIVERLGMPSIKTFPLAWAIVHLEKCLLTGVIDIRRSETLTALMWLHMFFHVVGVWQHHPRFSSVAKGLGKPKSFLHTASQLIVTAYLYQAGNRVGLALEDKKGEPNPDLYINGIGRDKTYLEVKAPEALQWGGKNDISVEQIETTVRNCIKRSSDQINRTHRGVLIISSSLISDFFPQLLEISIQKELQSKGHNHKSLSAVIGISPMNLDITGQGGSNMQFNCQFSFSVTLNKHFDGKNPIVTNKLQGKNRAE